ncbi:hypothetical protein MNV49_007094 [Pseudohyphozyma bogoriensis]|nr:hypothetical protein MNV49_007094 [Pseudohyphozyma bogoriensis]
MPTYSPSPKIVSPTSPLFAYEGIQVHPDHGLVLDDCHAAELDEDADVLPRLEELVIDSPAPAPASLWTTVGRHDSLSSSSSSSASSASFDTDYFSNIYTRESSPASSASSTPTLESPSGATFRKEPLFDASPNQFFFSPTFSFSPAPPSTTSTAPSCNPKSPSPLSPRVHPYSRPSSPPRSTSGCAAPAAGGASMLRSYSMPVETQRELNQRMGLRSAMGAAMEHHAPALLRSKSLGVGVACSGGVPLARRSSVSPAPTAVDSGAGLGLLLPKVHGGFEEGWGAALPQREAKAVEPSTYPYNVVAQQSPQRVQFTRSNSVTDLPTYHTPFYSSPCPSPGLSPMPSPTSSSPSSPNFRRRGTLTKMTPILGTIPQSPPRPGRVARGLSF